jgi:transcriptional regulator with XRE-family HTH domain
MTAMRKIVIDSDADLSPEHVAANLRLLCSMVGSVSEVCRRLKLHRSQFNRYLAAKSKPTDNTLRRICDFFGVETSEIALAPGHFERIVSVRRRSAEVQTPYAPVIAKVQRNSRDELRRYLGYFYEYYYSMSSPGKILRGLVHFFEHQDAVYVRRIEHFGRSAGRGSSQIRCRYVGAAVLLEDRIFIMDVETLTNNEITETILFPSRRNQLGWLSGLVLGVSSNNERKIACARVLFEHLGETIDLRVALSGCGLFMPNSGELDPDIEKAIDNNTRNEGCFTATPL